LTPGRSRRKIDAVKQQFRERREQIMAIRRWTPFEAGGDGFDEIVRRTFGDFGSSLLSSQGQWAPALDAKVEGDELHVRLELPGIDPDSDVDIEVEGGVLHVSGERKSEDAQEGDGWFRREMRYGRFDRRVGLPDGVDAEGIRASYDAGVLDIAIPMPAKAKTKVKVDVGTQKQLKS
jgi:HSP20 family protein